MGILWAIVRILALVYVGLGVIVFLFQSRFIYFPHRKLEGTPEDIGLPYEEVHFSAGDGVKLHGWFVSARFVSARRGGKALGAVLFCHGNAGNISHRLVSIEQFTRLGLDVFIFDYRGYGRSEGKPSEKGTYLDAEAAWDYLARQRGIAPERIVVFGRSLGGAVAARIARDRRPAAVIVESAFTSVPDMAARVLPIFPVRLLSRFRYNTAEHVAAASCPVLVVHSPDDEMIPFNHGERIFQAAGEPKEFLQMTGSHNEGFLLTGQAYERGLERFISRHLPEAAADQ